MSDNIISEIESAFQDVRLDGGRNLEQADALDNYEVMEAQLCSLNLSDERWQDIPDDKLRRYVSIHPFLDTIGFRFYLPAYLRWVIRHLDDEQSLWNHSTIYSLIPTGDLFQARFASLSPQQSWCVCRFLRYVAGKTDDFAKEIDMALKGYWGRYCAQNAEAEQSNPGSGR